MPLKAQIHQDLKNAMFARDKRKVDALRLITAAIKQVEVDERIEVDGVRLLTILSKLAKQRMESINQFSKANRHDLVEQEQYELDLIDTYLPQPLTDAETIICIEKAFIEIKPQHISDMSKVMAYLKPLIQGRADMSKVSQIIKEKLS